MTISLNSNDSPIRYDTRIDYYIDLHQFAAELIISCKLPVLISHLNECYCFDVSNSSFENEFLHGERKVIVAGTRNWITRQEVANTPGFDTAQVDFFTSLIIAIEVKSNEIANVKNLFSLPDEALKASAEGVLQNALEVVLYRYNSRAGGISFLDPAIHNRDRVDIGLYTNYVEKRHLMCQYNLFEYAILNKSETPLDKEAFLLPVQNWRYFLNKSINEYLDNRFVDSIISAAISIEAYAWEKAKSSCSDEKQLNEYATEEDDGKVKHLSATRLYKKLLDDGLLDTNLSKTKLEQKVQQILNPRNDIMHGKASVAESWGHIANKVNVLVKELYMDLSEHIEEDYYYEEGPQHQDLEYRDWVLKFKKSEKSPLDEVTEAKAMMQEFPSMVFPKVREICALIRNGEYKSAALRTEVLVKESQNKTAIAVEISLAYLNCRQYDLGIELLEGLGEDDNRTITARALLHLRKYQQNRKQNAKSIKDAERVINTCSDNKYLLKHIIKEEILKERLSGEECFKLANSLSNMMKDDYLYPLRCVEYAFNIRSLDVVSQYMDAFLDRFEASKCNALLVDYLKINIDLSYVGMQIMKVLNKLENHEELSQTALSQKKRFKEALSVPRDGILRHDTYAMFDKGGMPNGNLIFKELPNIPGGTFVYK